MRLLNVLKIPNIKKNIMSIYTQVLNPITGQSEWQFQDENYDYHQEIARAAFADMLHDTERNKKYLLALEKTIKKLHQDGSKAHVLDIGTGTGLLSMMAVNCRADTVTACEAFMPMANCAEKIIQSNGMQDKIKLIKKRSTDIIVGESETADMAYRCNVLVTEVFDTELIGEGAIGIFNHAHEHLLTDDCIVIPSLAIIYAQIAESSCLYAFNKPKVIADLDGNILLKTPDIIKDCPGEISVHDVQLSQLSKSEYKLLTEPVKVFTFDFNSKIKLKKEEMQSKKVNVINNGNSQAIFFWWELKMDFEHEIILSCSPYWAHPDFKKNCKVKDVLDKPLQNCIPWRDHWIQGIYYLPNNINVSVNESLNLISCHDEYSFWFNVNLSDDETELKRPNCICGFHLAYSRNRVAQLNNSLRNKKYLSILENQIDINSVVVSLSEGSLLGLSTIAFGAKKLFCFEPNNISRKAMELYIEQNNFANVQMISSINQIENIHEVTHIIGEPYFTTSILPWDNFYFGYLLKNLLSKTNEKVKLIPGKARIIAIPVEFIDLQKIQSPIGLCEGFNMNIFDNFINDSVRKADAYFQAQPLWEYPCKALAEQVSILTVDFKDFFKPIKQSGQIPISFNGNCNGIVCWVDWILDSSDSDKYNVTNGAVQTIRSGQYISWNLYAKQAVHLIPNPTPVNSNNIIEWQTNFQPQNGDLSINFNIK